MPKRIKVLHLQVICNLRVSDLQEEIIEALPVEEFEVVSAYMIGNPETSSSGLHSKSERVKYFNFTKKELQGLRIQVLKKVLSFCRDENFDVVIAHRFKALDTMMKLNKLLKIPHCISVVHNLDDFNRFYRKLNAFIFLDDKWTLVTVSQAVNDYLCQSTYAFDPQKVLTINNAIDTEKMLSRLHSRDDARKQLKLESNCFVFGTIGRMVSVKGYIYLIKAFAKLYHRQNSTQQNKSIKLVLIGAGKIKPELEHYVREHRLEKAVIFPGEIIDAKLLLPAFDVFVLSSLSEGLPLVLLEAMAAKLPVIATNVGGVPSVMPEHDKLVPPKNIEQLYEAMSAVYNMTDTARKEMGEMLFLRLTQNFDIKQYRKKYYDLVSMQ